MGTSKGNRFRKEARFEVTTKRHNRGGAERKNCPSLPNSESKEMQTKQRIKKTLVFGLISSVLGISLATGLVISPAIADSFDPNSPPALNVLPSTVTGAYGANPTAQTEAQIMANLYTHAKDATFWKAKEAEVAGVATESQAALLSRARATYSIPATIVGKLTKVVGGVALGMAGYSFGTEIGNSVAKLLGVNTAGVICSADSSGFLSLLSGQSCSFGAASDYVVNYGTAGAGNCNNYPDPYSVLPSALASWTNGCNQTLTSYFWATHNTSAGTAIDKTPAVDYTAEVSATTGGGGTFQIVLTPKTYTGATFVNYQDQYLASAYAVYLCENIYNPTDVYKGNVGSDVYLSNGFGSYSPNWTFQAPHQIHLTGGCSSQYKVSKVVVASVETGTNSNANSGVIYSSSPLTVPSTDPSRTFVCTIVGSDSQTYSATSAAFHETDSSWPTPVCPTLPSGVTLASTQIKEVGGGETHTVYSKTATPQYLSAVTLAPECSTGTCLLDLKKSGQSCFQNPTSCADWFQDPNRSTNYSCTYGTHSVDLTECYVYANSFTATAMASGQTLSDPQTGVPQTSDYSTVVGSDTATTNRPVVDPSTANKQCFPNGWAAFNPVEWILEPTQCALEWAFVPRQSVITEKLTAMQTAFALTPVAQIGAVVTGWHFDIPPAGCDGVTVDFSAAWPSLHSSKIMGACPGSPLHPVAVLCSTLIGISAAIGSIKIVSRNFAGVFGYGGI